MKTIHLYGKHTVTELLQRNPERIQMLYLAPNADEEFRPMAASVKVRCDSLANNKFMRDLKDVVHQGVVARVDIEGLVLDYRHFMDNLEVTPDTSLLLLNEITDPYNVGAIIRSAAAFGVAGVLVPTNNQAPITGAVAKASVGAIFSVPLISINNENQTILDLKKRGFWSYGLDGEATRDVNKEVFDAPAVFVVGGEAEGLREKTREHCDFTLKIPMHPRCESLNASVSAAIVMAEWSSQHKKALSA